MGTDPEARPGGRYAKRSPTSLAAGAVDVRDDDLVRRFAALSSKVRLAMLRQMWRDASVCACAFDIQGTVTQSTVSHHLRVLREAGLVRAVRCGTFVRYSLEPGALEAVAAAALKLSQSSGGALESEPEAG